MDGRGGCCIARYSNGGVYGYDTSQVDRIMLRFRPIAPKPVSAGDPICGGAKVDTTEIRSKSGSGRGKKRQGVSGAGVFPRRCNKKRKTSPAPGNRTAVTLPLLPEKPEPKETPKPMAWLTFECDWKASDRTVEIAPPRPVGSSVTVECVTDTWTDGFGLGRTDEERRANLERDTCPGFLSDGFGRVTWTNQAYGKIVSGSGGEGMKATWLVMKERLPVSVTAYPAFTCRVRLQRHVDGGDAIGRSSVATMPCDVWRLDGGGFAWRLDVKAALCLGR